MTQRYPPPRGYQPHGPGRPQDAAWAVLSVIAMVIFLAGLERLF